MTRKTTLQAKLTTATTLIAEGELVAAEAVLQALTDDPDRGYLGPETALGLPRRLQAAWLKLAKARSDRRAKTALQYHLIPPPAQLADLFRPTNASLQATTLAAAAPVPRVLHQVWIGQTAPETTDAWRDHAARHGWDYRLWDIAALTQLGVADHPTFQNRMAAGDLPGAVDVARYAILSAQGGLYLDCDWMPVTDQPFQARIPMAGLSAMAEATPRLTGSGSPFLNNSIIAAPKGHPAMAHLLETLPEVLVRIPKGPAWWVTGPLVFTLAARMGPVNVLDAALEAGMLTGDRAAVDAALADLRASGSPAYLAGWKPWG